MNFTNEEDEIMFMVYEQSVHVKNNKGSGSLSMPMSYNDACKKAYQIIQSFGFENVQLYDNVFIGKKNGKECIVIVSDKHTINHFEHLSFIIEESEGE